MSDPSATLAQLQAHRKARLQDAADHLGDKRALGQALGYDNGAFIYQMSAGLRPISEKTVAAIEALPGMAGWFDGAPGKNLGGRVKELRVARGWTQEHLVNLVNEGLTEPALTQQGLSALEGRGSATSSAAPLLAKAFGVDLGWLLTGSADSPPPPATAPRPVWRSHLLHTTDGILAQVLPQPGGSVELILGYGAYVGTTLTPDQVKGLIGLLVDALNQPKEHL